MKILVTGATGYIGSHTVVALIDAGHQIIALDNLSNSSIKVLDRINEITGVKPNFYQVDLTHLAGVEKVFKENKFDAVIHFAGLKAVGESVAKPLEYYSNNIIGTLNLLQVMKKNEVSDFVFSSSATVYGNPKTNPILESFPLSTTNPYGTTKLMIEDMLRDICNANAFFNVAILRYFNPVGAHKSGLIGESPNGIPNNLMPFITKVATGELKELSVFGSDYETPDGTGVRDYIHVVDLAMGHLRALERLNHVSGLSTYNLGTGTGYSVLELVKAFEVANDVTISYKLTDRRPGDIATCFANCDKAKDELGWVAKYNVVDMCRDAWHWETNNRRTKT